MRLRVPVRILITALMGLALLTPPGAAQMTYGGVFPCQYRLPYGMLPTSMSMSMTGVGITFTMLHACSVTVSPNPTAMGAACQISNINPVGAGPFGSFCNSMTVTAGGMSGTMAMTSQCAGLLAQAPYGTGAHMCSFMCTGCPGNRPPGSSYVIDNSNGLPVELMDFAVNGPSGVE